LLSGSAISRAIEDLKSEMIAAAGASGRQVAIAEVDADHDYFAAFDAFAERRAGALVVAPSAVFANDADETGRAPRDSDDLRAPRGRPTRARNAGPGARERSPQ
jgi:hypothetical protein